ncbi:hypothetical protein ACWC9R_14090 [Streptomyces sp. NPDC001219]
MPLRFGVPSPQVQAVGVRRESSTEHLKRLTDNGIQPHFMLANLPQLETVERLIRAGVYTGPVNLNHVAIGGGASAVHPAPTPADTLV